MSSEPAWAPAMAVCRQEPTCWTGGAGRRASWLPAGLISSLLTNPFTLEQAERDRAQPEASQCHSSPTATVSLLGAHRAPISPAGGWSGEMPPHLSPGTPQAAPTTRAPAAPLGRAHLQSQETPLASVPSSFHRGCKSHRSRHSEPGSSAGAPAGSGSFGTAPTAQRDTGLCLTNRWHQCSHSQVWWQRRTCCPVSRLPREWGPAPQPWGGPRGCCLQNPGSKGGSAPDRSGGAVQEQQQ